MNMSLMIESDPIVTISPQQTVFLVKKGDIKDHVRNWEKNRPEDPVRIKAIAAYNEKFDVQLVDGVIYAWHVDNMYKIYDGWTRYTAATDHMQMLLCVNNTDFENDIIIHFIALNSAVPVPALYIHDTEESRRKTILEVVDHYCTKYKVFLSSSTRPQRPNFNRDIFTDQLSQLAWENLDKNVLIYLLDKTNVMIKEKGQGFPTKAENGKFYLFADKKAPWQHYFNEILKDHLTKDHSKTIHTGKSNEVNRSRSSWLRIFN